MRDLVTPMELARDYNLLEFYQVQVGNIIVPDEYYTDEIGANIREFLQDNIDWVLGHEENYWYLVKQEDLN